MPVVRLEVRSGWSPQDKKALLDAAHTALVEALKIPEDDRTQRIVEHASEDFELPPDKSERFVLVEVTLFAGRSLAAKRRLYRALVSNIAVLGVAPSDITIVLYEVATHNWGVQGGHPASEVDLGFEVEV
jgi:phenylpyruvate tautomerase PptA (4-oxalocrotonate tautomerase family)